MNDRLRLIGREHAGTREGTRPRDRALHVLREQLAVEGERVVEGTQERRRRGREAASPHRHCCATLPVTSLRPNGASRFRPRSCKPKRRMKPAESLASYPVMLKLARS